MDNRKDRRMLDQNIFMETVRSVMEITKTSATPLPKEEILSYFKDMELTEAQQDMVYEYFLHPQEEETAEEEQVRRQQEEADKEEEQKAQAEQTEAKDPDSVFFQMFLEDLESLPVYSKEQEQGLYEQLAQGQETAITKLSECWMKRVLGLARKHWVNKVQLEDLIQEGNMGLFLGLQSMCGKQTKDPKQVIEDAVVEAMRAYISEITGEDDSENTILGKVTLVHEAKKMLTQESGHEPDLKELADYTKLSEKELEDILAMVKKKEQK